MLLDHLSGQRTQVRVPPLFNEGGGFHELLILAQAWCFTSKVVRAKKVIFSNICFIKFRSKHSSNTVLCLLRNLMKQMLGTHSVVVVTTESQYIGFWIGGPLT